MDQDPTALLRQAVQLHQQGRLEAAQALYRQVLEAAPRQFDALHLLGVIERQRGDPALAARLIADALAIDPQQARAHCNLGAALQDLGRARDALDSYEAALRLDPHYALAWDNRGNALRRLGRPEQALDSYERALGLQPGYPEAWCHRAIVLHDLGRDADAAASARQALAARPGYADALLALGNALQGMERPDEAVDAYDRALAAAPGHAETWCARGAALRKSGDLDGALGSYDRALALRPGYALAEHYRANTLRALGRRDDAVAAYRRALALGADAGEIGFSLAALAAPGDAGLPAAAPADYVRGLFDQYAGHFDRHLVDVLGYRTPALLDALLRRHGGGSQAPAGSIADLGCGTGLCAPFLRPAAAHLAGVDLSPRMLDKARATGLYDELACTDIGDWLAGQEGRHDLLVAADVLVYIGALETLFARARAALRPGGRFALSCEALDDGDGYAIRPSNRYAHALAYVERCAVQAGLVVAAAERAVLRREHGADVEGWLVLLRR